MSWLKRILIICATASFIGLAGYGTTVWSETTGSSIDLAKLPPNVNAVLYALPLVVMDVTREETLGRSGAMPNQLVNIPILSNASFRTVVRPNVDTLYSTAWLDLRKEPVVMTLPPSDGRFFLIQCMDAWTNVFADPGVRTLGNKAAKYEIAGPDWHGSALPGVEVIRAPTPMVWIIARVFARNHEDLPAARAYQGKLDLRPLGKLDDPTFQPAYPAAGRGTPDPIMMDVLKKMGPGAFFERFMALAAANPPAPDDAPFIHDTLAPLGVAPGRARAWESIDPSSRQALSAAFDAVLNKLSDRVSLRQARARRANGWNLPNPGAQGRYGTRYAARAAVAVLGLGAKNRADGLRFNASVDGSGQRLDGGKTYRLTFALGDTPPAQAFWSLTLYDDKGYLVANPLDRYAVRPGEGLVYRADGSLVIYLQPDDPGPELRANWLPTPAGQTYELSLRAYWPNEALLKGQWIPPPIVPARSSTGLVEQPAMHPVRM